MEKFERIRHPTRREVEAAAYIYALYLDGIKERFAFAGRFVATLMSSKQRDEEASTDSIEITTTGSARPNPANAPAPGSSVRKYASSAG